MSYTDSLQYPRRETVYDNAFQESGHGARMAEECVQSQETPEAYL